MRGSGRVIEIRENRSIVRIEILDSRNVVGIEILNSRRAIACGFSRNPAGYRLRLSKTKVSIIRSDQAMEPAMIPRRSQSDLELARLQRAKIRDTTVGRPLGPEMIQFFKQSVAKRQTKLSKIAEVWGMLVPSTLNDHCALESLNRGVLAVVVDSSSHLYELKQLFLAGLQQQLLMACKSAGLRKINLRPGRWYDADEDGRKIRFD
jgi:hypothetical protein